MYCQTQLTPRKPRVDGGVGAVAAQLAQDIEEFIP
jgi:hypothetical protein